MIIAERKPLAEIIEMVQDCKKILVLACRGCVTVCSAGGEREAEILASVADLEGEGHQGVGEQTVEGGGPVPEVDVVRVGHRRMAEGAALAAVEQRRQLLGRRALADQLLRRVAQDAAVDLEVSLKVYFADNNPEQMVAQVQAAVTGRIDGIIFPAYRNTGERILKIAEDSRVPAIMINSGLLYAP